MDLKGQGASSKEQGARSKEQGSFSFPASRFSSLKDPFGDLPHEVLYPAAQPERLALVKGCLGPVSGRLDHLQEFGIVGLCLLVQVYQF